MSGFYLDGTQNHFSLCLVNSFRERFTESWVSCQVIEKWVIQEVSYPRCHLGGVDFGGYFRSCLCTLDKNTGTADKCRNVNLIYAIGILKKFTFSLLGLLAQARWTDDCRSSVLALCRLSVAERGRRDSYSAPPAFQSWSSQTTGFRLRQTLERCELVNFPPLCSWLIVGATEEAIFLSGYSYLNRSVNTGWAMTSVRRVTGVWTACQGWQR